MVQYAVLNLRGDASTASAREALSLDMSEKRSGAGEVIGAGDRQSRAALQRVTHTSAVRRRESNQRSGFEAYDKPAVKVFGL